METPLLGPIVGQVTSTSAIVLIEMRGVSQCRWKVGRSDSHSESKSALKWSVLEMPSAATNSTVYRFCITHLPQDTAVHLYFCLKDLENQNQKDTCPKIVAKARVHTRCGNAGPNKIVGLSCHDNIVRAGNNPWADLVSTYSSDTVFVHLGDQVYMDGIFWKFVRRLAMQKNGSFESAQTLAECEHAMREFYRRSWTATEECRMLFATFSHVMIADDHEVVNEYGRDSFESSGCPQYEKLVADIAKKLFLEYQDALWLNSSYEKQKRSLTWPLYRTMEYADTVLLFISGEEPELDTYLLQSMPSHLRKARGGSRPKNVVVCSAVPPIECAKFETTLWTPERLTRFYKNLYTYMESCRATSRAPRHASHPFVTIISGDWHLGVEATMRLGSETKNGSGSGDHSRAYDIPLVAIGPLTNFPDLFSYMAVRDSAGFCTKENNFVVSTEDKRVLGVWNAGVVNIDKRSTCLHALPATWKFWSQAAYYPILLLMSFLEKETPDLCYVQSSAQNTLYT